jgi:hypothetical protein
VTGLVPAIGAIVVAGTAATLIGRLTGGADVPPPPVSPVPVLQAEALTRAQPAPGGSYSPGQVRAVGIQRSLAVPLPAGGTFSGIEWENGGPRVTNQDIDEVLEYNAACQWLRAWHDGRETPVAVRVLQTAPQWPALRGTDSGDALAKVATEVVAGGGPTVRTVLRDCQAAYARERRYAARVGLDVTR